MNKTQVSRSARSRPNEVGVFKIKLDGRAPEELLKAGNYDWVSYYGRQIVGAQAQIVSMEQGNIEIVLLYCDALQFAFGDLGYDQPDVRDALYFGEQFPIEQCEAPIVFPHQPWAGPYGISFVLVLRSANGKTRGLDHTPYTSSLKDWWESEPHQPKIRIAVRRRRAEPASGDVDGAAVPPGGR